MQKWEAEATTAAGKNVPNGTNFVPALIEALGPVLVVYSTTGYRLPATWVVCNVRNVDGGLDVR
jgi:hypothetical protein